MPNNTVFKGFSFFPPQTRTKMPLLSSFLAGWMDLTWRCMLATRGMDGGGVHGHAAGSTPPTSPMKRAVGFAAAMEPATPTTPVPKPSFAPSPTVRLSSNDGVTLDSPNHPTPAMPPSLSGEQCARCCMLERKTCTSVGCLCAQRLPVLCMFVYIHANRCVGSYWLHPLPPFRSVAGKVEHEAARANAVRDLCRLFHCCRRIIDCRTQRNRNCFLPCRLRRHL